MHFDHDMGDVGATGDGEEVTTTRTELGTRKECDPFSSSGGNGGRVVVDCAEKFDRFGEVAEEVGCVDFCVGEETWFATIHVSKDGRKEQG